MKYYNFSRQTYNSILSFYLEIIEKDEVVSVSEISKELEIDPTTIRRFIERIKYMSSMRCNETENRIYTNLYHKMMLHTKFIGGSKKYAEQQEIIEKINKRKEAIIKIKQKTKEYNQKKN